MTHDEMFAIIQADKENKTIQVFNPELNDWCDLMERGCFTFGPAIKYRVKPESHYRPFKSADECIHALHEYGDWVWLGGKYYKVVAVSEFGVIFGGQKTVTEFSDAIAAEFVLTHTSFGIKEE